MTLMEFGEIMARLAAAYGTGFGKPMDEFTVAVYYDALGDIPLEALRVASKRVMMQQKWFPTIHELRQAASETQAGEVTSLPPAEAWALAWRAACRIDPEVDGSVDRACAGLPLLVVEALRAFGVNAMVYGKEPVGVIRGQFLKIYEQIQAKAQRERVLPAQLKQQIKAIGAESIRQQLKQIGVER